MKYIPELDSFRALAVIMVIVGHWLPFSTSYTHLLGLTGVVMFFTLSGYLITRILLSQREQSENGLLSKKTVFKNFYVRRMLRIFPIYYLYIFFLFLIPDITGTTIKTDFFWYFTYLGNFYNHLTGNSNFILGHTWSLAVEEQFYLVWPFVILFVNKHVLPYIMACMVIFTLIFRFTMLHYLSPHPEFVFTLPPSSFDAFGLGALLAWLQYRNVKISQYLNWSMVIAGASIIFINLGFQFDNFSTLADRTFASFFSAGFILLLINSKDSFFTPFFRFKPLIFIGKISYGLYLFHFFVPWLFEVIHVFTNKFRIGWELPQNNLKYVYYTLALATISISSWFLVEKPLLSLKSRFR